MTVSLSLPCMQPYGGPDALKSFVDAAHELGLAVLLDVVYNHFGPSGITPASLVHILRMRIRRRGAAR